MRGGRGRHVTLVVPGLLGSVAANNAHSAQAARLWCEGLSLPALERFFSRSRLVESRLPERELAALLFGCFGVAREGPDWPAAAVTRQLEGASDDGRWWLRADPVHLRAGMGDLTLLDGAGLRVTMDEAEAFAADINGQLDEPDLRLEALAQKRWYLGFDERPDLVTEAPWEVSGSPIGAHLPRGEDAGRWQARINDVQMILHASPVNRARERRGEPVINSLWLWGGGRTPRVPAGSWQGVWGDDDLVAGLAGLAKVSSDPLPEDAHPWLALAESQGDYLLVSSAAYVPVRCRDVDAWRMIVSEFEKSWMAPLLDALTAGRLQSLSLRGASASDFLLERGRLGHWWRSTKPFSRIMSDSD